MTIEKIITPTEMVKDSWEYSTENRADFIQALTEFIEDTEVTEFKSNEIHVTPYALNTLAYCDPDIREHANISKDVSDEAIMETGAIDGSNLIIKADGNGLLLSNTAAACLVGRLGCQCPAISKIPIEKKAEWLNTAAKSISPKKLYAIVRGEKVRGVVSERYNFISQTAIFNETIDNLRDDFDDVCFTRGSITHEFTSMDLVIDDELILEDYKNWLSSIGFTDLDDARIIIRVGTSDTTDSAVNLSVHLVGKTVDILLGTPVKMAHFKSANMEVWKKKICGIAGHVNDLVGHLKNLGSIKITYPETVYTSIGNEIGMSKKMLASEIWRLHAMFTATGHVATAHDVFYLLYKILYENKGDMSKENYVRISENLSKCLHPSFAWSDFDTVVAV